MDPLSRVMRSRMAPLRVALALALVAALATPAAGIGNSRLPAVAAPAVAG